MTDDILDAMRKAGPQSKRGGAVVGRKPAQRMLRAALIEAGVRPNQPSTFEVGMRELIRAATFTGAVLRKRS